MTLLTRGTSLESLKRDGEKKFSIEALLPQSDKAEESDSQNKEARLVDAWIAWRRFADGSSKASWISFLDVSVNQVARDWTSMTSENRDAHA